MRICRWRWLLFTALVGAFLGLPAWGQHGGGGGGGSHGGGGGFHSGGGSFGGHASFGGSSRGFGGGFGSRGGGLGHPGFGRPGFGYPGFGRPGWGRGWGWGWGGGWPAWGFGLGWGYPAWGYPYYSWGYPYYYGGTYDADSYYGDNGYASGQSGDNDYYAPVSPQLEQEQDEIDRLNNEAARLRAQGEAPANPSNQPQAKTAIHTKTVLIFQDKHSEEVQNYAIVGQTLWVYDEQQARKIKITDLDVPATKKANDEHGVDFQLPN